MSTADKNSLSEALVLYLGYGTSIYPKGDDDVVLKEFGVSDGNAVLKRIKNSLSILDVKSIDWGKYDLNSAADMAVSEVLKEYPNLDSEAQSALKWVFTWWNK